MMIIESLKIAGNVFINVPSDNLSDLGLSGAEIAQIISEEVIKNAKLAACAKRDALLLETDYLVMPDYPLVDKSEVEAYRQVLRDITLQAGYPLAIEWPELNQGQTELN
jgi:hypothetical protein